jgi:hypothetical protein
MHGSDYPRITSPGEISAETDVKNNARSAVPNTVMRNSCLFCLLKIIQASSQNRYASPIKYMTFRHTATPDGYDTVFDYYDHIDECIVRAAETEKYDDIHLWEAVDQYQPVSLHVIRRRLWALTLRHVIQRDNITGTYRLHEKWSTQIREALR